MKLSIVVLNYKMRGLVKNCLKAIYESELRDDYEVIVVDNASHDGVEKLLAEKYPTARLIKSEKNLGMGGGNNLGIEVARGDYILILNPDIFVFPNTLARLLDFMEKDKKIGLLSPKLLNPDKSLQYTCYRKHNFLTPIFRRTVLGKFNFARRDIDRFLMKDWTHDRPASVDWIQGSCVLSSKEVLTKVGGFDDNFFMYFEDTDLCRRIQEAGYKTVYLPEVEVIHLHRRQSADGGSLKFFSNKMTRVHISSWLKFMYKWRI